MKKLNENTLTEQPVINWFKNLGYEYKFGPDISTGGILVERDFKDVILESRLKNALKRLNPDLPEKGINEALYKLKNVEHPNLEIANREVWRMLTEGVKVEVEDIKGELRGRFVKVFDFENSLNNDFLVVNQFTVQGIEKFKRPDVVVFINGIPIAIFELKNPQIEEATIETAYDQLQEYKKDIFEIFKYNQILVVSDLLEAKYGTISSSWEWFKIWRGINDPDEMSGGISELEVLVKGLFQKSRLLDIIENFIVFETDSEKQIAKYTKKIALYHQYFGVNKAVEKTLMAIKPESDKKIGVFWHTQGSGKTLSAVFYVNKAKKLEELESPTFVFLTDRNDLDNQFYKTFLRTGYATLVKKAETIKDLEKKIKTAGGELIFTTIQKFAEDFGILSERQNIIVIADEAHRSQYANLAARARKTLPNASFMGITATPISLKNKDTLLVFGDYISKYPMSRAVKDKAIVPIYYEGRLIPLHLTNVWIDERLDELIAEVDFEAKESLKKKLANLEQVVSAPDRLKQIAQDIIQHFKNRGLEGKAMVVTISRKVAVEMYKLLSKIEGAPEMAVVVSKPEEYRGEIQNEIRPVEIEGRFKDPDDPLKIVIVCDMWLTGFDVPHLHTMYFDKPLKNHSLIQTIARVNRIYKDKPGGLIVDYIGIADDLRRALNIYDAKIQKETLISLQEIITKMQEKYNFVKSILRGVDYSNWKYLEGEKLAQLFQQTINTIITNPKTNKIDESQKKRFLKESQLLLHLFAFAMPHQEAYSIRNDVEFFRAVRNALIKRVSTAKEDREILSKTTSTVKELISENIAAEGIIDIFALKDKKKAEISILNEKFLEEIRKIKYKNVAIEALKKLLNDEIKIRMNRNRFRYKSLLELLEKVIEDYENRVISSTRVIERLIDLAKEIKTKEKEGISLGLGEEELSFYDTIAQSGKVALKDEEIKNLVKELVKTIRRDLTVDWTNNEVIKSKIRANIKLLLLRKNIPQKEVENISETIYSHAAFLFKNYAPVGFI